MDNKQLPTCSQCAKPVERFTQHFSDLRSSVIYTVYCHGQKESVEITDVERMSLHTNHSTRAQNLAFRRLEILAPHGLVVLDQWR